MQCSLRLPLQKRLGVQLSKGVDDVKEYMYPDNLKGKPILCLWYLRDIGILGVGAIISVILITTTSFYLPLAFVAVYGFLSIRTDDVSILDFIIYACNYFVFKQQYFVWEKESLKGD